MDILFTNFEGGDAYGNVTLENNVFEHTTTDIPGEWNAYSVYVGDPGGFELRNWTVRNNTFETTSHLLTTSSESSRWVGNLGDWDCVPGVTYRYNVGQNCSDLDQGIFPATSTQGHPAPFGWVDSVNYNFHLKPTSFAIDAGDPDDFPATDHDGN